MKLASIKELAILQQKISGRQNTLAIRNNSAIQHEVDRVEVQFGDHFKSSGFKLIKQSDTIVAMFEGARFLLDTISRDSGAPSAEFRLTPPPMVSDAAITIKMTRKGGPGRLMTFRFQSPIDKAKNDFAHLEEDLQDSAVEFHFQVIEDARNNVQGGIYASFTEVLQALYPA